MFCIIAINNYVKTNTEKISKLLMSAEWVLALYLIFQSDRLGSFLAISLARTLKNQINGADKVCMRSHAERGNEGYHLQLLLAKFAAYALPHKTRKNLSSQVLYPHLESPQFRQVMQPSIRITALVLHFMQRFALDGKSPVSFCVAASFLFCLLLYWFSFSCTSFC